MIFTTTLAPAAGTPSPEANNELLRAQNPLHETVAMYGDSDPALAQVLQQKAADAQGKAAAAAPLAEQLVNLEYELVQRKSYLRSLEDEKYSYQHKLQAIEQNIATAGYTAKFVTTMTQDADAKAPHRAGKTKAETWCDGV